MKSKESTKIGGRKLRHLETQTRKRVMCPICESMDCEHQKINDLMERLGPYGERLKAAVRQGTLKTDFPELTEYVKDKLLEIEDNGRAIKLPDQNL